MAPTSEFAHVVYKTHRFPEMVDWYERVFEARVQCKNDWIAFLTYDDEHFEAGDAVDHLIFLPGQPEARGSAYSRNA